MESLSLIFCHWQVEVMRTASAGSGSWRFLMAAAVATCLIACPHAGRADDAVILSNAEGKGESRRVGEVLEWTGEKLVFRHASGREETIDAQRIVEVDGDWGEALRDADSKFQQRDYKAAAEVYRSALSAESRAWVKRRILARLVRCYRYLGQVDQAGQIFLAVYRNDPTTQYFRTIPLCWTTTQPSRTLEAKAKTWLADSSPVARLLGASWLLSTGARSQALDVLDGLTNAADARVIFMVQAQRLRTQAARVSLEGIRDWESRVRKTPADLRAGPYFVLGEAWARHERHEQAALAYLRVPLLYEQQRELAARALLAAARELKKIEQTPQARRLCREILTDYPEQQSVAEQARQELETLSANQE